MQAIPKPTALAITYFDQLITSWGRACLLVFQDGKTECPNCLIDHDTSRSSGIYQAGGPNPFDYGLVCPVCNGSGLVGTDNSRPIQLNITGDPKKWMKKFPPRVDLSAQAILSYGFITDLPDVLRSQKIFIQTDLSGYTSQEYFLAGLPFDPCHIVPGRYFFAYWDKSGGS